MILFWIVLQYTWHMQLFISRRRPYGGSLSLRVATFTRLKRM